MVTRIPVQRSDGVFKVLLQHVCMRTHMHTITHTQLDRNQAVLGVGVLLRLCRMECVGEERGASCFFFLLKQDGLKQDQVFFLKINYLFIFGCVGSSLLRAGFL